MAGKKRWGIPAIIIAAGLLFGALLAAFSPGAFFVGFWQSSLFSILLATLFYLVCNLIKPPKTIVLIAIAALFVRLTAGIWLTTGLPAHGFNTPVQKAGYAYSDAYDRDRAAYAIAFPDKSGYHVPANTNAVDQYGGMMMISAGIYRLFSMDVHRPLLIIFLSALSMALAVIFTWKATQQSWTEKVALIASVFLAFYPEGILLGSSQMREPLLICLASIMFWATILLTKEERSPFLFFMWLFSFVLLCWISIPAGLAILVVNLGYLQVLWIANEKQSGRRKKRIIFFGIFLAVVFIAGWMWLKDTLYYDAYATETESGLITWILSRVGTKWRFPFVLLYGLIQPVLPAALVYQSLPIWKSIAIFRAFGWYFVLPFLGYGIGLVINKIRRNREWALGWLMAVLVLWIFISSARAGGDQWDNPRYRAIFLPWLVLIVGLVWDHISKQKSPWFWRFAALDIIFVLIFIYWYLGRKFPMRMPIPTEYAIGLFGFLLIAIIAGGFFVDHQRQKRQAHRRKNTG